MSEPTKKRIFLVACAALGGFLFGYDTSVVNGALFQMKTDFDFDLNSWKAGLIVAVAIIGAVIGSGLALYAGSAYGRKPCILVADILFISGSIILCLAPVIEVVYVGRFVLGLGIGLSSVVVPVYLAELSSAESRGRVVAVNNFFLTGGQMIAAAFTAVLIGTTAVSVGWRVAFGIGAIPALIQLIAILSFLPETSRYLRMKGKLEEALKVEKEFNLDSIDQDQLSSEQQQQVVGADSHHPHSGVVDDRTSLRTITYDEEPTDSPSKATGSQAVFPSSSIPSAEGSTNVRSGKNPELEILKALFTDGTNRRRLVVGAGLQMFQQLCGINTIMYYSGTILHDCGFRGDKTPVYWSVPLAATNAFFTLIAVAKVDHMGRRGVLLGSLIGCLITTAAMSIIGFAASKNPVDGTYSETVGYIFLVVLFLYLASFAPGMGPCPWIVNSEIYPTHMRTAAASVATMANWGSNVIVSQLFPIMMGSALGVGGTFLAVVICCVLGILFVFYKVPETKGKTLEEITELFAGPSLDYNEKSSGGVSSAGGNSVLNEDHTSI